jgi:hypothetical protein
MSEEQPEMVLLTEKCTERNCGTRVRYGELTDDVNTHWHIRRGIALVPAARFASTEATR